MHALLDPDRAHKLIKAARAPIAFAFLPGKTPDKSVLAVDKTKTGKALFELCKTESGLKKGAHGSVTSEGPLAVFTCDKDEVANLEQAILRYFKANGVTLKVELATPDLEEAEEHEAEHEETPAPKPRQDADPEQQDEARPKAPVDEDEDDVPEGKIFQPDTIVALIRKAATKPRPFAFGIAAGTPLLCMHPRLAPKRLAAKVKQEGARRGAWGLVGREGAVAIFTTEKEPFPGLRRGLKRWFKEHGLTLKLRVQGPGGEYDDPEDVEIEDTPETDAPGPGGGPLAELRKRVAAAMPGLKAVAEARPDLANDIRDAYAAARDASKDGDTVRLADLVDTLEALAAAPLDAPVEAEPEDEAAEEEAPGDEDEAPAWFDRPSFEAARQRWTTAVDTAEAEVQALVATLRKTEDVELHAIADMHLGTVMGGQRVPLTTALFNVALAQKAAIGVVAERALTAIATFRTHLDSDPRIAACERNPFGVSVSLRAPLRRALADLEATLRAA